MMAEAVEGKRAMTSFSSHLDSPKVNTHAQYFIRSKYLRVLEEPGATGSFIYHSLFGNLHLVDGDGVEIINRFAGPTTPAEVLSTCRNTEMSQGIIDEFLSLYYLVPEGFDERDLTAQEL